MPHNLATLLNDLIKDALTMSPEQADAHLATWLEAVPEGWHPVRVYGVESSIESYDGCDVYPDLMIMNLFNHWRRARIMVGGAVQEMADGICASVPFALGDRDRPGYFAEPGAKYPHLEGVPTSETHYRAASALGGWYLVEPLKTVKEVGMELREGQKEWVLNQMVRLKRIYDIKTSYNTRY
jgi:hypothetical protein